MNSLKNLHCYQLKNAIEALNIPYDVDVVDFNNIPEALKAEIERIKVLWK